MNMLKEFIKQNLEAHIYIHIDHRISMKVIISNAQNKLLKTDIMHI